MDPVVLDGNVSSWWESLSDEEFQFTFRMGRQTFTDLQAEIDYVEKRHSANVNVQLLACVWFLGNTMNYTEITNLFEIHDVESCLLEYSRKIIMIGPTYITWPTIGEASYIEKCFASDYDFPGVVGVIGSLYIEVKPDQVKKVKSVYYNKDTKKHMIILQIVSDNHLLIRDVSAGFPGGETVDTILKSSPLYAKLIDKNGYLVRNGKHLLGGFRHPELTTLLTPYDLYENEENIEDKKEVKEELECGGEMVSVKREAMGGSRKVTEFKQKGIQFKWDNEMECSGEVDTESDDDNGSECRDITQSKEENHDKVSQDNINKHNDMDIIQTIEMQMEEIHSEKRDIKVENLIQEQKELKNMTQNKQIVNQENTDKKIYQLQGNIRHGRLLQRKYNFNILHDSVMETVEQTFRTMEMRFPRLTSVEMFGPSFSSLIVTAICILHNFTRVKNDNLNEYN